MATVTGYTAAKMDDMEKSNITGARLEINLVMPERV